MRLVFFLAVLTLAASARALLLADAASFYAMPGEKAIALRLAYGNSSAFLVVVNGSAVAVLEKKGEEFAPVLDYLVLARILSSNASAVASATNKSVQAAVDGILNESFRHERALRLSAFFGREEKFNSFEKRWRGLLREFDFPRKLSLPRGDALLEGMRSSLASLKVAKKSEAREEYARQFDDYRRKADALERSYRTVLLNYRKSTLSILNASKRIDDALENGLLSSEEAEKARRELASLEATLISAEAILVDGRNFVETAPILLDGITANATRLSSGLKKSSGDNTLVYASIALAALALAALAFAFVYRQKLFAKATEQKKEVEEELTAGITKVLEKIKEMEK